MYTSVSYENKSMIDTSLGKATNKRWKKETEKQLEAFTKKQIAISFMWLLRKTNKNQARVKKVEARSFAEKVAFIEQKI